MATDMAILSMNDKTQAMDKIDRTVLRAFQLNVLGVTYVVSPIEHAVPKCHAL